MKRIFVAILILLVPLGFVIAFLLSDVDGTATALYELLGPLSSSEAESRGESPPSSPPETEPETEAETEAASKGEGGALPEEIGAGRYIYENIGEEQQTLYREVFHALDTFAPNLFLSESERQSFESEDILSVFNFVLDDSPELFWVDPSITVSTLQSDGKLTPTEVRFSYLFSEGETAEVQRQVDAYEARCLAGLAPDAPLFNKILHVYEYIINNTEYDLEAKYNQNLLSVALYGESVCKGYARMTQYLLNRLGVPCTTVNGYAGEAHSWNLIDAEGDYYYLDSTWGDPQKLAADTNAEPESYISYRYFMITGEELAVTHTLDEVYPYPVCDSTALNYYTYTGRLFDTYDYGAVSALMRNDFLSGGSLSTFRFTNEDAYRAAIESLVDGEEAHAILSDLEAYSNNGYAYSYSSDDDFLILDFML